MPRVTILALPFLLASSTQLDSAADSSPAAYTYYISADGNDSASGLSPDTPFNTLDRANTLTLHSGDALLLRSGDIFPGQLHPAGNGVPNNPIRIDRYGTGPLPIISLGSASGAAVKLTNQQYVTIENLEITSGAPPEPGLGRQGICVAAEGPGCTTHHIIVRNCYIHDLWGQLGGTGTVTGYNSAAIFVGPQQGGGGNRGRSRGGTATTPATAASTAPATQAPRADDITIENNKIERVDRCGIIVWHGYNHIFVRGNSMENLGGDGIFMNGPIAGTMERNVVRRSCLRTGDPAITITSNYNPHSAAMWIQNSTDTLMQFNEAYDTGRQPGNGDGNAYDFDFNCTNCIAQYNYSKNNHGFLLIMERTKNNIARYNISENDQTHLVQTHGTLEEGNQIYNNVFYVDYGTSDIDIYMGNTEVPDARKALLGAHFENNIFYATGQGRFRTVYTYASALNRQYMDNVKITAPTPGALNKNNWYFGPWSNGLPDDPTPHTGDPLFVAPGTGTSLSTLTGYQLLPNSPCINTATPLPNRGSQDLFGNPLKPTMVSFGANEPLAR